MELRNKQAIIANKMDFKPKLITRDMRDRQFMLIKGKTQQQDVTILNIDMLNKHIFLNFVKERLFNLKSQIDSNRE